MLTFEKIINKLFIIDIKNQTNKENQMDVYSKYDFSIINFLPFNKVINNSAEDLYWQLVEVNGTKYVKTPFTQGKYSLLSN